MTEINADQSQNNNPDAGTKSGKQRETSEIHLGKSRRNGDQLTDRGKKTADKCCQVPVLPEHLFRPVERLLLEKEIFAVFMQRGPPQIEGKIVVDKRTGERSGDSGQNSDRTVDPDISKRQLPAIRQKSCRNHHDLAGKRNKGTFHRHKEKDQEKSPEMGILGGVCDVFSDQLCHKLSIWLHYWVSGSDRISGPAEEKAHLLPVPPCADGLCDVKYSIICFFPLHLTKK